MRQNQNGQNIPINFNCNDKSKSKTNDYFMDMLSEVLSWLQRFNLLQVIVGIHRLQIKT